MESESNAIILKPGQSMKNYKKKKSLPKVKIYSEKELYALNKKEQVLILEGLEARKIPRYEKNRVTLIMKLQK